MIIRVSSINDPQLNAYAHLTDVQLRCRLEPERGIFIAESQKVIDRALAGGMVPLSLCMEEKFLEGMAPTIAAAQAVFATTQAALATTQAAFVTTQTAHGESLDGAQGKFESQAHDLPIYLVPHEELQKLTGFEVTRGALGAFRRPALPSVEELCADARRVVVLEDITNHTNVGAIFRSAAALGIDAVLVTQACYDPLYRRAVRVSMGTVFQVPWTRIGAHSGATGAGSWAHDGLPLLHELGFKTAALALSDDSIPLDDPRLAAEEKLALVLGTEGDGLAARTIAGCDYTVRIPMAHEVDSLNVAAASAVAFWQLRAN